MEYKTIQFEVVETTNPYGWKWGVFLDATRTRTGIGLTRADAVLDAEFAIDQALDGNAVRKATSCGVCNEYLQWMLSEVTPVDI
jgi:hypothetical protein